METQYKEFESLVMASTLENITLAESLVDLVCKELDVNADYYGNVLIAVTEAVNNAIKHGNNSDPTKNVKLQVFEGENTFEVVVSDEGKGFDYSTLPDPTAPENIEKEHGRGIFLMSSLSDEVAFENEGNTVRMKFSKS